MMKFLQKALAFFERNEYDKSTILMGSDCLRARAEEREEL
jgi:hypothetical protein